MEICKVASPHAGVLSKWIVSVKNKVTAGCIIAEILPPGENDPVHVVSTVNGTLKTRLQEEGTTVSCGDDIADVEVCSHPAFFKGICVSCGDKIVQQTKSDGSAGSLCTKTLTVTGGHTVKVSVVEARRIQKSKIEALRKSKKLALVLDLDNTLVHATATSSHPPEVMAQATPLYIEENGKISR